MNTSRSRSSTFHPSLEVLEARDVPSAAGDALFLVGRSYISPESSAVSGWTSNLQIDFATLQQNIHTQGWTPVTVGSLVKTTSDYSSAEQTYNFAGQINGILETGLLIGAAAGMFGQEDAGIWLFTWNQLHNLESTISNEAGIADGIAHSTINTPNGPTPIAELAG